jgi:hypothetical protein
VNTRIICEDRGGQWVARAFRADTGDPFGIECVDDSRDRAIERLTRWLDWQREHTAALDALQQAERAYHRTIAGSAFALPTEGPNAIELFELLVLADLRRRGFSVHQLHTILRILREQFGQRLYDVTGGGGSVQLLTDGRDVYARADSGAFYNLLRMPTQPLLVIGDESRLKELSGRLRRRRRRR